MLLIFHSGFHRPFAFCRDANKAVPHRFYSLPALFPCGNICHLGIGTSELTLQTGYKANHYYICHADLALNELLPI
ncbi:hypothetical protein P2H47_12300 [Mannheimia haemolytica]|uniref:hypothetical protein n=1 Tax=Mannheimia haemolytica TaxID=75985 RepID=UPI001FD1B484|nr:hypothetical protein [Mannheimia haemolytica]MDW0377050.1 hypothetical protein [Mannheimia haemolytica]MDW0501858.1 hypothetical protein [Mannheimia haemolytica]MDW0522981.1 hypothetical protein [Mannheimia haemolytica]MDW0559714.1 hypothetical protein [Mannheimia haemolytica]MDW0599505.1 hypothetical protein [Mannheimia haemolytica]